METKLNFAVIAVLISFVVCLAVVLVLIWTMPELPTTFKQDQICLPNKADYLNCGVTADLFHEYLERVVAKRYDEIDRQEQSRQQDECKMAKGQCENQMPAVKLTGRKQSDKSNKNNIGTEMTTLREWHHDSDPFGTSGFKGKSILYQNGRLIVPVDGSYFVHSFVEVLEHSDPSDDSQPIVKELTQHIKHCIFKLNKFEEEIKLVSNVQPRMASQSKHFNLYNSYVSSLVELKAGDKIFVKISSIMYLKNAPDNYFGIHLV